MDNEKPIKMRDDLPPDLQALMKHIRDNFIIAIVKRNGGEMTFSVKEIDDADDMLTMEVEGGNLVLKTQARN